MDGADGPAEHASQACSALAASTRFVLQNSGCLIKRFGFGEIPFRRNMLHTSKIVVGVIDVDDVESRGGDKLRRDNVAAREPGRGFLSSFGRAAMSLAG